MIPLFSNFVLFITLVKASGRIIPKSMEIINNEIFRFTILRKIKIRVKISRIVLFIDLKNVPKIIEIIVIICMAMKYS
ncbi:MAG: hypothetical protein QXW62_00105 [Candidatus Methanomethylicaceae archaeon]|nr:hypothetical protein [Candidatus Verstraetearchaeota archaeon]